MAREVDKVRAYCVNKKMLRCAGIGGREAEMLTNGYKAKVDKLVLLMTRWQTFCGTGPEVSFSAFQVAVCDKREIVFFLCLFALIVHI